MRDQTELLAVWERGTRSDPERRALLLHAAARPGTPVTELLDAPVGGRDADLLRWYGRAFGSELTLVLPCGGCAEELEFGLAIDDLLASGPGTEDEGSPADECEVSIDGWSVRLRAPRVTELWTAAEAGREAASRPAAAPADAALAARDAVLRGCVLQAQYRGDLRPPDALPVEVVAVVAERLETLDPLADPRLDVPCGECGHRTQALLDVVGTVWAQLDAWARETLLDVHLLASSYGWRESDVLALSPTRRALYLELAGHG